MSSLRRSADEYQASDTFFPAAAYDFHTPLTKLSSVKSRMDDLHCFLAASIHRNELITKDQMDAVSSEIASAVREIIVSGCSLLACTQSQSSRIREAGSPDLKFKRVRADETEIGGDGGGCEIVEMDAVELLADHVHVCEICGKGFKRDANLRMHMRAHGNQFKTPEALAKPTQAEPPRVLYGGCSRNKKSEKSKSLKSVIRFSHCPKMYYACDRCNRKSFSVAADLKSHLRRCGEPEWRCSYGTSFSRKDVPFGQSEGHMAGDGDQSTPMAAAACSENGSLLDLDRLLEEVGSGDSLDIFGSSSVESVWNYSQLYDN